MSSLIVPSSSKYKTLQAVTARIDKVDSRETNRRSLKKLSIQKDLRKRSLNFHNFTTLFPTNAEVAISTLKNVHEEKGLRKYKLRNLIHVLARPGSPEYKLLASNPNLVVETVSSHFREIPPKMYPGFVTLFSYNGFRQTHGSDHAIVLEKLLREFLRHVGDTDYSVFDLCNVVGCCRKYGVPINPSGYTTLQQRLAGSGSALVSLPRYFIHIPPTTPNNADFRLLRILIRELAAELQSRRNKPKDLRTEFLGRINLISEPSESASTQSNALVFAIETLGRFLSPTLRLPRRLYDDLCWFINSDTRLQCVERIRVLSLFAKDATVSSHCRVLIHDFLKTRKNLRDLPHQDLQSLYQSATLVGYVNPFQLRRLRNVIRDDIDSGTPFNTCLRDHQVCVDERFRRLTTFAQYHHVRKVRRRIHRLMGSINVGRVSSDLVLKTKVPNDGSCRVCQTFYSKLALARKFHES